MKTHDITTHFELHELVDQYLMSIGTEITGVPHICSRASTGIRNSGVWKGIQASGTVSGTVLEIGLADMCYSEDLQASAIEVWAYIDSPSNYLIRVATILFGGDLARKAHETDICVTDHHGMSWYRDNGMEIYESDRGWREDPTLDFFDRHSPDSRDNLIYTEGVCTYTMEDKITTMEFHSEHWIRSNQISITGEGNENEIR